MSKSSKQEKISIDFRILMAIAITLIFWASAFAGIRVGLKAYSPENLVLLRFLTASIALSVYAIISRMTLPEKKDLPAIFFLGFIGITVYHLALTFGELKVTAGSASLLIASGPIFTAFTIDGNRTDIDANLDLIQKIATEGHMDELTVVDTFGGLDPHAVPYLIKKVKESINDKPIGVHFHDDFGLGAANTIIALASGAEIAHILFLVSVSVPEMHPMKMFALSLLTMYGIDTGLKYDKIYQLSKYLQENSGIKVRQNRGIVGDDIANIESGIVAAWFKNAADIVPLELSPYLYSLWSS